MKRKSFIKRALPVATLPFLINGLSFKAFGRGSAFEQMLQAATQTDKVLVLIQLNGGNDGLNTVIPLDQYSALSAARANILINQNLVLALNGTAATGLHPSLTGIQNLYNDQKVTIVQGVSYPNPSFSHFRATDIWLTGADSNQTLNTGWVGGSYGTGSRIKLAYTRSLITAALTGELDKVEMGVTNYFGLQFPKTCKDVPSEILDPRNSWADKAAYDAKAKNLAEQFIKNFDQYASAANEEILAAAPKVAQEA